MTASQSWKPAYTLLGQREEALAHGPLSCMTWKIRAGNNVVNEWCLNPRCRNSLEASCHPRRRRVTAASAGDTAACSYLAGLGVVACAGVFGRRCFASHAKIDSPASSATRLL